MLRGLPGRALLICLFSSVIFNPKNSMRGSLSDSPVNCNRNAFFQMKGCKK